MNIRKIMKIVSAVGLAGTVIFMLWCWRQGILTSEEKMQAFLDSAGWGAGLLFVILQILQVVVPIIPGGISCLVGVVMFGAWKGFIFNYVGICIGSILVFLIARFYGRPLMHRIFDQKLIQKYEKWTEGDHQFTRLFAAAIFFPVAPDDFLCYLAGTTRMKLNTYIAIILLGKPASIAIYSMGLNLVFRQLLAGFAV